MIDSYCLKTCRDFETAYTVNRKGKLKPCPKKTDRFVIMHWKPPGCVDYVEKCRTEVLHAEHHVNIIFSTKVSLPS